MSQYNKIQILEGDQFGRLTIVKEVEQIGYIRVFLCKCECGRTTEVRLLNLRGGHTKSCGCFALEEKAKRETTHGESKTKLYAIWSNMIQRCTNQNVKNYNNYGGRGITVCDEWLSYEGFCKDMKEFYKEKLSLDRIDNSKGYSKYNCKWSTSLEQGNNKRNNKVMQYNGKPYTLSNLSRKLNVNMATMRLRLLNGMTTEEAILFTNKKAIIQCDINGNELNEFQSVMDAKRKLGINQSNILSVINGLRQTAGGFKWKLK